MAGEDSYEPSAVERPEDLHSPQAQESEPDSGGVGGMKWPGWPGENVFRMLVPVEKVGGIIGRKGEFVKRITEETRARIRVLDGPPGTSERAVMVSAKEEPDAPFPPAIEGLLRIHKQIVGLESDPAQPMSGSRGTVITRLLVADTQAGCLIGKQGSTIKSIQDASDCTIRVLRTEHLPVFALEDDSIVEIQGDPMGVHKAVELIASNLRKFLVDHSIVGVFETQMQMPRSRANQNMATPQSWGAPHGFEMNADVGPDFGPNQYMQPSRQYANYYSHNDLPPFAEHPHQGPPAYGNAASMEGHLSNVQTQQSIVTKITQHMQIPLSYADAVIGTSGANISYIRRASGAAVTAQETRGVPGEMTVEIHGSASQVQAAQQLIQNFMAEAASSAHNPAGGSISQEYVPYPAHGHIYASTPSHAAGHTSHAPSGDYGSAYGSNYGY